MLEERREQVMSRTGYLGLGIGAVLFAAGINPFLAAVGLLHFRLGAALAVIAPILFGGIAVGAGIDLYQRCYHREGVGIALSSLVAVLIGIRLGLGTVF